MLLLSLLKGSTGQCLTEIVSLNEGSCYRHFVVLKSREMVCINERSCQSAPHSFLTFVSIETFYYQGHLHFANVFLW